VSFAADTALFCFPTLAAKEVEMELLVTILLLIIQAICLGIITFTILGWRIRMRNSAAMDFWDQIEN
jgi:hypothetical protein